MRPDGRALSRKVEMKKELICIECPKGCPLSAEIENGAVISVSGNKCPKGMEYAVSEIQNPRRILTSSVLCKGLSIKMLPVRTDKTIPKETILEAMDKIRQIRVERPVRTGDIIVKDFMAPGVNLISSREIQE